LIPARRRWLAGCCLGLLTGPLFARDDNAKLLRVLRRWATGSATLAPPTAIDGQRIVCAGERTLALINIHVSRPIWKHAHGLPEGAVFRPRVAASTVVCAGQQALGAWRLGTGSPLWRYDAREQIGVPCPHRDRVFFGDGHELVCLELASGKELWRFASLPDTQISYAPTVNRDTVFVGPGDGRLYALDSANGTPRWTLDRMPEWQYLRQLHTAADILVAGSYKEILYGIDSASGRQLWEFNAGNFINSHHVADGIAYLWSPTGWLYAIDARSGAMRWRHRTTDYRGSRNNWASLMAELVTQGTRLYALDLGHVLHVLDTARGNEIARLSLPEPVRPFVLPLAKDTLLFGAENGDLLLTALPG
jgi:outer membrane protein assembly factor BamB